MKKFLMITTAIAGASFLSAPASAAVDLNVGGYFSGYVVNTDIDGVNNTYDTEFRRDTELHFGGETVLDNGLTVGARAEIAVGNSALTDSVSTDEVYAYVSNAYGRVNLGDEDGAAYLLQVVAPSADSNVDGADVTISGLGAETLSYAQIMTRNTDRITYLSPKVAGFQAGISYAPRFGIATNNGTNANDKTTITPTALNAAGVDTVFDTAADGNYADPYELSARYDGEFQGFGFSVGAGFGETDLEVTPAVTVNDTYAQTDGLTQYNFGANVAYQGFTLGGSYGETSTELTVDSTVAAGFVAGKADYAATTYVIGAAYDNGPYHAGVSYLNQSEEADAVGTRTKTEIETDRYTVGGGYSFGPGMTFRGAVAWSDKDTTAGAESYVGYIANASKESTQITVGTDIQF